MMTLLPLSADAVTCGTRPAFEFQSYYWREGQRVVVFFEGSMEGQQSRPREKNQIHSVYIVFKYTPS